MKYLTFVAALLIASSGAVTIRNLKDDKKEEEKGTPQNNLDYWARENNARKAEQDVRDAAAKAKADAAAKAASDAADAATAKDRSE